MGQENPHGCKVAEGTGPPGQQCTQRGLISAFIMMDDGDKISIFKYIDFSSALTIGVIAIVTAVLLGNTKILPYRNGQGKNSSSLTCHQLLANRHVGSLEVL